LFDHQLGINCRRQGQDVLAGRKTEVEMFSLAMMELGKNLGIPVPVNEMLYLQLRTIERTYV
jgi:2-dehydropantoate 2-reductase